MDHDRNYFNRAYFRFEPTHFPHFPHLYGPIDLQIHKEAKVDEESLESYSRRHKRNYRHGRAEDRVAGGQSSSVDIDLQECPFLL